MADRVQVTAGGGVVWRIGSADEIEVALVHRPRYDDWSLPKGKREPGETILAAAVREVHEEIGSTVAVSRRLGDVRYRIGDTRKTVSYWVMRHLAGEFVANREVDELVWLPVAAARGQCSYELDRGVLDEFASAPPPEAVLVVVRHARAGKRTEWAGADQLRPLDPVGVRQAARLVALVGRFGPTRVVSADPTRCVQTIEPTAAALGLPVEVDATFGDEQLRAGHTAKALLELAEPGTVTVVCSQGSAIPTMIEDSVPAVASSTTRKAAVWVLGVTGGLVESADYYTDAI